MKYVIEMAAYVEVVADDRRDAMDKAFELLEKGEARATDAYVVDEREE